VYIEFRGVGNFGDFECDLRVDSVWIHRLRSNAEKGMKRESELMYTRRRGPHGARATINNLRWTLKVDERLWNQLYAADALSLEEYERMVHRTL
jgi:hypothetical protein